MALLDQIHHGQKDLPTLGQIPGQFLLVHFSPLADGVVANADPLLATLEVYTGPG